MQAVILAGGFGTRLRSLVPDVPKPLAPIGDRPFLAWLIEALAQQGVTGITLSVYHQWEKIQDYFDHNPPAVPLRYAVEERPLGTGGAIAYALEKSPVAEPVLVLNGDSFAQVDYRALYRQHCQLSPAMTMVLRAVPDTGRYGEVLAENGSVTAFRQGSAGKAGLINAGVYVVTPQLFTPFAMPESFSFEQDFMQAHVKTLKPHYFLADDYFIDIGVPEDYARACRELPEIIAKTPHTTIA